LSYKVQLGAGAVHLALHGAFEPFLYLGDNQNRGGEGDQKEDVVWRKGFRLENHLQRRKVDDQHLSNDREGDGQQEHAVGGQSDGEYAFCLRAAGKRIEHVEEHEASEGHGRVPLGLP